MYLDIGGRELLPEERIIGVFDLDRCTASKRARSFLDLAGREGVVLETGEDLPRSFVVCDHPYHRQSVYLSQYTPATLRRRWESREDQPSPGGR